ncbi:MAG: tetratricopeptide repeat protein [Oscillatoriaceae cyanobacterium Prado104]|jgi:tetratricopeptide (TPR) repeat protein|nr:tetratricopeptide repeat protein [Oscillatoriaceae cyanobacterium Prado104]
MDVNTRSLAQSGETLRLSKAYDQAIEIFERILKEDADNVWVNAHLGATYHHLMEYRKAEECLKKAIEKNDNYFWAHAQLGETYRLWALSENRREKYIKLAIEHFEKALGANEPEDSNYAWVLAHLGATYRLKITGGIIKSLNKLSSEESSQGSLSGLEEIQEGKENALKHLDRALELIPTYAWGWGMRSTVYRLAQEYEDAFFDLEVEAVIAPNLEILQNSSFPVPFLESNRVNLYEHAFLFFYLTKNAQNPGEKQKCYQRAIAFLQQALILRPGDLIAKLLLTIIQANQKKENGGTLNQDDIKNFQGKLKQFFEDTEVEFFQICKKVLRHQMNVPEPLVTIEQLRAIDSDVEEGHILKKLIFEDLIGDNRSGLREDPQLWLWKNLAVAEMCTFVLFFLGEISDLLGNDSNIGTKMPYLELAFLIKPFFFTERLYQSPVFPHSERKRIFNKLKQGIGLNFYAPS